MLIHLHVVLYKAISVVGTGLTDHKECAAAFDDLI